MNPPHELVHVVIYWALVLWICLCQRSLFVLLKIFDIHLPHSVSDSRWRCARAVSTILCVHKRRCQPTNCSGHGDCVDGRCRCQEGWQGDACDSLVCQPAACGAHGVCTACKCGGGAQLQQLDENRTTVVVILCIFGWNAAAGPETVFLHCFICFCLNRWWMKFLLAALKTLETECNLWED